MNKLILPLFLALVVATGIMATPLLLIQSPTKHNGVETVAPVASDEKNQSGSSFATTQTVTQTSRQTELSSLPSISGALYMLATGILVASATTFVAVKVKKTIL
ncbi:MAG: hypothetical protein ACUVQ8_07120 [Nitrososphaeria archaeon]